MPDTVRTELRDQRLSKGDTTQSETPNEDLRLFNLALT